MRNNCGVLAYDQLVGQINGRTNNISLDSLAKIAQDNGFILFPMRIPLERLKELRHPYIVHHNHHFECWDSEVAVDVENLSEPFYVLSSQCIPDLVVTETEARGVKGGDVGKMLTPPKSKSSWSAMTEGSTGGWAKGIEPWGAGIEAASGAIPVVGPFLSAGEGLIGMTGKGTGFQGTDAGFGGNILPMLGGALGGYGMGGLGSGLAGGIQGLASGTGFMSGAGQGLANYGATTMAPFNGTYGAGAGAGTMVGQSAAEYGLGDSALAAGTPYAGTGAAGGVGANFGANALASLGGVAGAGLGASTLANPYGAQGMSSNYGLGGMGGGGMGAVGGNYPIDPGGSGGLLASNATPTAFTAPQATSQAAGQGINLGNLLKNPMAGSALGLGLMGAGAMQPSPTYQQPSSVDQLRAQLQSGQAATPIGQQAQASLSKIMSTPFNISTDPTYQNAVQAYNAQLDTAMQSDMQALTKQFGTYGSPYSGELQDSQQKLVEQYAQAKQSYAAQLATQRQTEYTQQQMTALSQASGIDQNTMADLMGLTGMDVTVAAQQYGVQAQDVASLRQMLGNAGTMLTAGSMGMFSPGYRMAPQTV